MLYTIGHSTKTINELIDKLLQNHIQVLVDVRSIPYSKWNPQFNKSNIEMETRKVGIKYEWRGKSMGGLKGNVGYDETVQHYAERVKKENIVVMCSEGDYKKCHRYSMLTPSFLKLGVVPKHLLWDNNVVAEMVNKNQHTLFD